MAMRRLMAIQVSWRSNIPQRQPLPCLHAHCHLFATILRRDAPASASGGRIGGVQWHRDPSDVAKEPAVKNGKEAFLECRARCARGLRCRKSPGTVAASGLRNCALCATAGAPGRLGARQRIWSDIMQRRESNAND
jgi:hypothetical protein